MSPAGGGVGGGLDNPIASTYHLFNPLYNTAHIPPPLSPSRGGQGEDLSTGKPLLSSFSYAGCLQMVATICCRRNYWFHRLLVFPALFSCSFSTPCIPAIGGQWPATFPVDFVPLCVARKARTNDPCSRHTGTWFVHATQPNRLT